MTDVSFERHAGVLTARYVRVLGYCIVAACLVWWPVDHFLYRDAPEIREALFEMRSTLLVAALGSLLALRALGDDHAWVKPALGLAMTLIVVAIAHSIAALDVRFFMAGICLPLSTIPLTVNPRERLAYTVLLAVTYAAVYFGSTPVLPADTFGTSLGLLGFSSAVSIVFGHVFYSTLRDNHAQRLLLDERARKLEELDELKNDFFANVSHELRTPLTLVLGHLQGLSQDLAHPSVPRESASSRVETAQRNAARLLVLIEELLDLARLTSGQALPRKRALDVNRLVVDVVSNFRPSSPTESTIELELDPDLRVEADPRQLRTALHNLVSNAMKFTSADDRKITVRARASADHQLRIEVIDNGIGIPFAKIGRIFDRFYRVERGYARHRNGTGIGLALVKEIADAHGGRIEVESELDRGSRFTLVLPLGDVQTEVAPSSSPELVVPDALPELHRIASRVSLAADPTPSSARATTVVIAEDDPDLRRYVASVLARDHRVLTAEDGAAAIALVRDVRPDALVTDVMMPGTSGLDLARALRSDPDHARLPILFLTARAGATARSESYDVGADDFLTKPFDETELRARVANLIALRASERALASSNRILSERVAARTADLRKLAEHLERAREEDRRHLAREIHDETGQLLTALRMELDLALDPTSDDELKETLVRMTNVVDQTLAATRNLVAELRPRVLDDLGLGAAVEWFGARFAKRTRIACTFRVEPPDLTAAPTTSTAIYRVLQESLTNVVRHSRATAVAVSLVRDADRIVLEVADDGVGVDPSATSEGTGIIGMRERAEALGGSFTLTRRAEGGTLLALVLPDASETLS